MPPPKKVILIVKRKKSSIKPEEKLEEKPEENTDNVSLYINQLSDQEKMVFNIAKEHLETSFCIEKSIGYLNWTNSHSFVNN